MLKAGHAPNVPLFATNPHSVLGRRENVFNDNTNRDNHFQRHATNICQIYKGGGEVTQQNPCWNITCSPLHTTLLLKKLDRFSDPFSLHYAITYEGVRYWSTMGRIILVSSLGMGRVPLCTRKQSVSFQLVACSRGHFLAASGEELQKLQLKHINNWISTQFISLFLYEFVNHFCYDFLYFTFLYQTFNKDF